MTREGSCPCGAVQWRFDGLPESATACNCTACPRDGTLRACDREGAGIHVSGPTTACARGDAHFDGFGGLEDLAQDGRCVRDHWF